MIQAAYTLLVMAMTLLTSVSGNVNVSQDVKDGAINIANSAITYAQQVIAQGETTPIVVVSPTLPNTPVGATIPTMKPAYTYDELMGVFNNNLSKAGILQQYMYNKFPIYVVNIASTTADIGEDGYYTNFGDVIFNGKKIITWDGKTKLDESNSHLTNLTSDTEYHYQFVYHEDGREDTVIDKTFKTLAQ